MSELTREKIKWAKLQGACVPDANDRVVLSCTELQALCSLALSALDRRAEQEKLREAALLVWGQAETDLANGHEISVALVDAIDALNKALTPPAAACEHGCEDGFIYHPERSMFESQMEPCPKHGVNGGAK